MGKIPTKIDVLDLFCGNGRRLIELAVKHPKKVFVGVDRKGKFKQHAFPNLFFVKEDVLEYLRNVRQAGSVRHVNIDYGVHHLNFRERQRLYSHLGQVVKPGGAIHITTYKQDGEASPEAITSEAVSNGLVAGKRKALLDAYDASHSEITALHSRGATWPGHEDSEGAWRVATSVRLHFRVPRKTEASRQSKGLQALG